MKRKPIPSTVSTAILVNSRRRCCLCFYWQNDDKEKRGQIAHINRNREDHSIDNLVYLCLEHHDLYDSGTSQSKGIQPGELHEAKGRLYAVNKIEGVASEKASITLSLSRDDIAGLIEYLNRNVRGGSDIRIQWMRFSSIHLTLNVSVEQYFMILKQISEGHLADYVSYVDISDAAVPLAVAELLPESVLVSLQDALEILEANALHPSSSSDEMLAAMEQTRECAEIGLENLAKLRDSIIETSAALEQEITLMKDFRSNPRNPSLVEFVQRFAFCWECRSFQILYREALVQSSGHRFHIKRLFHFKSIIFGCSFAAQK